MEAWIVNNSSPPFERSKYEERVSVTFRTAPPGEHSWGQCCAGAHSQPHLSEIFDSQLCHRSVVGRVESGLECGAAPPDSLHSSGKVLHRAWP
jgi:hypothetical protein